ncbi:MAG: hypothetical protein PWQ77_1520 [Kosmotogales bacterium]|nr:hypothetical protein [Kosmotogales bacterium]
MVGKGIIGKNGQKKYLESFKTFWNFEKLSYLSDEEIRHKLEELRQSFLTEHEKKCLKEYKFKSLKKSFENVDKHFDMSVYRDKSITFLGDTTKFFELFQLTDELKPVFFVDSYEYLIYLMSFLNKNYRGHEITFVLKKTPLFFEPEEDHIEYIKRQFPGLKFLYSLVDSNTAGFDLRDLTLNKIIQESLKKGATFIVIGEDASITFEGGRFPYWVVSPIINDKFSKYAGTMPSMSKNEIKVIVKKMTGEWNYEFQKIFDGMERSTFNICSDVEKNVNNFMNLYSNTYRNIDFPDFQIFEDEWAKIILEREKNISEFLRKNDEKKMKYVSSYYDLKDLNKIEYVPGKDRDCVSLKGVYFKDASEVDITPFFASDVGQDLIDVRAFIRKEKDYKQLSFFINFLYFATENLVMLYNSTLGNNKNEKINFKNFFIDSYFNGISCTPSLYNKAYIGLTRDNEVRIGREELTEGFLEIDREKLNWKKECVNEEKNNCEICIYTPMYEEKLNENEFPHSIRKVGSNRYNIVIVDNRVVCIRFGEVYLPPFGVVVSLNEHRFLKFRETIKLFSCENGYFNFEKNLKVNFNFNSNKNFIWKYGGGSLLVKNGKNLMQNEKTAEKNFEMEGWYNSLSMKTQETQVQNWVRGPRSVICLDNKGGIFFGVFSGRTRESKGARFDEMIKILSEEIGDLKDVINLDGGSSSCLGMVYKNEFFELSYPSATTYTCAGMARPVNSFLIIKFRGDKN